MEQPIDQDVQSWISNSIPLLKNSKPIKLSPADQTFVDKIASTWKGWPSISQAVYQEYLVIMDAIRKNPEAHPYGEADERTKWLRRCVGTYVEYGAFNIV